MFILQANQFNAIKCIFALPSTNSMSSSFILHTKLVNLLVAIIIGLFVIFQDVIHELEDTNNNYSLHQIRHAPPSHGEKLPDGPPSPEKMQRGIQDIPKTGHPMDNINKTFFDFIYFFLLGWLLLTFNTQRITILHLPTKIKPYQPLLAGIFTLLVCWVAVYVQQGIMQLLGNGYGPEPPKFNGMNFFKCLFIGVISLLFGQLILILSKHQKITLENERLQSENLRTRFEALSAQINPHFFFNSLNALSGLIRENNNVNALKYINELSCIFRYVLKGNRQELVLLQDEMNFLDAYRYLLEIRYLKRLLVDIQVDTQIRKTYVLPALSLQPLIENVIKHNTISRHHPMTIQIYYKEPNYLVVSNTIKAKLEVEDSTGIGLCNLGKRYRLLIGKDITTNIIHQNFVVKLPLTLKSKDNESHHN